MEIDYKKEYEAMVQRARELHETGNELTKRQMEIVCPELRESEDERIRKKLMWLLQQDICPFPEEEVAQMVAYLEKQKEQKEELVYRLNGLMQDYIKEGKDDEEKEHRLKCYQLFWDALEDTNFFEQKEQKPNIELIQRSWYMEGYHDRQFGKEPRWIIKTGEGGPKHELNPKYGQPLADEQKPAEWSRQSIIDALTKWLTEKITPLHKKSLDGTITEREEMFMAALLEIRSLVNSPDFQIGKDTSVEWSEGDEKMLDSVIHIITHFDDLAHEPTFAGPKWTHPYTKELNFLKKLRNRLFEEND